MPRISKKEEAKPVKPKIIYSDPELKAFDEELVTYKKVVKLRSGEEVGIIDFLAYHQAHGSMNDEGAIIVEADDFGDVKLPTKYESLEEKIHQWSNWKRKREYGQRKHLEDLNKLAEGMKITPSF